ncbi:MAG: hypothetical protein J7K72_02270 [Candidatus Aenigmarchaeota archaeon]|nr:hypothetical protein [Candidatus Aenigmarchaeota archaeon]
MSKQKLSRLLKGIFRIQTGLALFRVWSLNKVCPRKTNVHLSGMMRKSNNKDK